MARFLHNKLTSTFAVTLLLTGCGGRTADEDIDLISSGGTTNVGGSTGSGGKTGYGGYATATGGASYYGFGGYYYSYGGYATGGYYYGYGGYATTGGYRATGGAPYATGGYYYGTGGKAAGGVSGYGTAGKAVGGISGYSFNGGAGGKPPIAGNAGFLRGGTGGIAGGYLFPGGTAGRGGSAGGGGSAGTPPGAGAGAAGCPAIGCSNTCPLGYWNSINGCSSCACALPDKRLTFDTLSCAADSLSVAVAALAQTGNWVFNFTWNCSSTAIPQTTMASVGVTIANSDPITSTNRTFIYNTSSIPIGFSLPQIVVSTSSTSTATFGLAPLTGAYLSIRREGNVFVGGLYLPANPTTISTSSSVILAGSFAVAVPQ